MKKAIRFPKDFFWGAATAAYQIEGGWNADGKKENVWDRVAHTRNISYCGQNGDIACDSYHCLDRDIAIIRELGLKAYRFSIAWSRVMPDGAGKVNARGLQYYDRLVDGLLAHGIVPFATMFHWDLPQALEDRGGWPRRETAYAFYEYAKVLSRHFRGRINHWMTLNEPAVFAFCGYEGGGHPPCRRESPQVVNQTVHNILLGHGLAVAAVREFAAPGAEVGYAQNMAFAPASSSSADYEAAKQAYVDGRNTGFWTHPIFKGAYPERIRKTMWKNAPKVEAGDMQVISAPLDFLGLNLYRARLIRAKGKTSEVVPFPADCPKTTGGFEITPNVMQYGIQIPYDLYQPKKIYITENGAGYYDRPLHDGKIHDPERIAFLKAYLAVLSRSIGQGLPVKGYFHWSLMDNLEWAYGYQQQFGLYYVDFETRRRIPKDSAVFYREVIRKHGFTQADNSSSGHQVVYGA